MTEPSQNLVISRIQKTGPISLAEFVAEALHNKNFGYYAIRDHLGSLGDFTTALEISQIFGELIRLSVLHTHQKQAIDGPLCLVEIGPGRGTLWSDIMRVLLKFENIEKLLEHLNILRHDDLYILHDRPWFLVTN